MPDFLLELLSEEIPARMQVRAADDLRRLVTDALVERGFAYEAAQTFSTPRRLVLHVVGLPAKGRDVREERKGPRVGAPDAALAGFLKSAGLASKDDLAVETDPKKGDFYVARIERPGRPTLDVLAEIVPAILRDFPWPKSMRWGPASAEPGSVRWVRPLQSILATFGSDLDTPDIVPFAFGGLAAGDATRGHRFLAPGPIRARHFEDYSAKLQAAKVVLDPARRREIIRHDARDLAFAQGLEVIEDDALLDEVAGLVEWPVVLMGSFDESFLAVPPEAIRATIRANQKCFVLRRPDDARHADATSAGTGTPTPDPSPQGGGASARRLANRFLLTANIEARDGGAAIVAGNERVVRARLSDARFFWNQDRAVPLEKRLETLQNIVFHEKLGTQAERVERIAALARELAAFTGADPAEAERAARLAKADLTTEMVGEFPELQGLMGRYYAAAQGEPASVAAAIEEHYRPAGPSDRVPTDPVSVAVALADKLDTLAGFWAIDEKPTGSKDPYALRRAALGVIRLVLENGLRLRLLALFTDHVKQVRWLMDQAGMFDEVQHSPGHRTRSVKDEVAALISSDLLAFLHDRLKVYLRDRGARHDLIDAVLSAGAQLPHASVPGAAGPGSTRDAGASFVAELRSAPEDKERGGNANDDLHLVVRRVEALGRLLDTEDGRNLLAAAKRGANILRIEEKKDGRAFDEAPDPAAFVLDEERSLARALDAAGTKSDIAIAAEDFEGAMAALATLRPGVDAFFAAVTVNDPDPAIRANRLRLLATFRRATLAVADLSKVEG